MTVHTFRLQPGDDLKSGIEDYCTAHRLAAASIVTCVGGLEKATVRMAGATPDKQDIRNYEADFEIVSLVGTISPDGVHLHMSFSDSHGQVFGGHLKEGSIVHPTAEIVLLNNEAETYHREFDQETGFAELTITTQA